MKNRLSHPAQLEDLITNEISVLKDLYACQKRMYECVLVRDWVTLQRETAESERIANLFVSLEDSRTALAREILPGSESSVDFYAVTASFEAQERTRINGLFREMKRLLLLSRSENEVFNTYVTNARTVVSGFLETMIPARRNRIYTKKGSLASVNADSLVLNRSF
jgi:hypothetical protein